MGCVCNGVETDMRTPQHTRRGVITAGDGSRSSPQHEQREAKERQAGCERKQGENRTFRDETSTVSRLGAPRNHLALSIGDDRLGFRRSPQAEIYGNSSAHVDREKEK
jgi:hypothetical protein